MDPTQFTVLVMGDHSSDSVPAALLAWAGRRGAVEGWTTAALTGGAVSTRVDRITLRVAGNPVHVVRKHAFAHEIAGLRAAQAVRPAATAVPELIAAGVDADGLWLVTGWYAGQRLGGREAPAALFDSLARLHAHYRGATGNLDSIPRVDGLWWGHLCRSWVLPKLRAHAGRHPTATARRAIALVTAAADHRRAGPVLARLEPTLLHGDVHPGNVIVDGDRAALIDWGSSRIGPAMLDLANIVQPDTAGFASGFAAYAATWREVTGRAPDPTEVDLGYRWAAVQLPIQYLPWVMEHRDTAAVDAALEKADRALAAL
jgi:aminoglycoside phosphotransferase (APT) family kinase protein